MNNFVRSSGGSSNSAEICSSSNVGHGMCVQQNFDSEGNLSAPNHYDNICGNSLGSGGGGGVISTNSGRRTSRVWKYFRMVDNCHYVCCLCSFVGAYTNTTNMRKHIQNHHPEIFQDILDHTRPSHRLHYLKHFPSTSQQIFQQQHPSSSALSLTAASVTSHYRQPGSFLSTCNGNVQGQCGTNNSNVNASTISSSGNGFHTTNSPHHYNTNFQYSENEEDKKETNLGTLTTGLEDEEEVIIDGGHHLPSSSSNTFAIPPYPYPLRDSNFERFSCGPSISEAFNKNSIFKGSAALYKGDCKAEGSFQLSGDDRKSEMSGFAGLSESSGGSGGDNQGASDEVSIPLSPEQFMSEESEHVSGNVAGCSGTSPESTNPQRPESYKLRHNNHLSLVLESLAGDESFMDVTLTAQGKAIKAHKSVLSAVSPYFRSVLKANPCQHPIIIMPRDIRFEELNNIISYIYRGEMTVAASDLSSLLKTAEVLQVTGLSPSDTGSGPSGIMSQMQGITTTGRDPCFNNSGHNNSFSKKSSHKKSHQNTHFQQQQQQQQEEELDNDEDDDEDDPMNEDTNDSQARVDPLEFLNADMTCVKEEVRSDDDDEEGEEGSIPIAVSISNSSSTGNGNESANVSPSPQNRPSSGSPKPIDDISSKQFNPGETDGSPDENVLESQSSGSAPYTCPHCLETHRPLEMLQSHLRLKHPSKPSFVCDCGRVYGRSSTFADHSRKCKF